MITFVVLHNIIFIAQSKTILHELLLCANIIFPCAIKSFCTQQNALLLYMCSIISILTFYFTIISIWTIFNTGDQFQLNKILAQTWKQSPSPNTHIETFLFILCSLVCIYRKDILQWKYIDSHLSGLVSSVRRALASKLKGPGFKSRPGIVGGPVRLEISFELNLLPRVNKVTLLYFTLQFLIPNQLNLTCMESATIFSNWPRQHELR